ncbi:MAG: ABC transporter substrate-binding protein [Pseudorhodoplanes sp.]
MTARTVIDRRERQYSFVLKRAALVLLGALAGFAATPASAQEKAPIKIGILLPLSGPAAAVGKENQQSIEYAFSEVNNTIDGHKVELLIVDDQNNPNTALTEARRLVEREKVVAVVGTLNSAVALALHPYLTQSKTLYFTGGIATDLTQAKKSETTFRSSFAAGQFEAPVAEFAVKAGMKRGILMGADYAAGRDAVKAVGTNLKELGGEVVRESFPRQGETDYTPFLSRIVDDKADFVYGYFFGGDTLRFIRSYRDLNLKFPLIITSATVSSAGLAQTLGQSVDGIYSGEYWIWTIDTPENKSFVDGFTKKFGNRPETIGYTGYIEGRAMVEALKKLNGDVKDSVSLAKALKMVDYMGPAGRFRFDDSNNPIHNFYMLKWSFVDGKAIPNVVARIDNVDQFWKPKK